MVIMKSFGKLLYNTGMLLLLSQRFVSQPFCINKVLRVALQVDPIITGHLGFQMGYTSGLKDKGQNSAPAYSPVQFGLLTSLAFPNPSSAYSLYLGFQAHLSLLCVVLGASADHWRERFCKSCLCLEHLTCTHSVPLLSKLLPYSQSSVLSLLPWGRGILP